MSINSATLVKVITGYLAMEIQIEFTGEPLSATLAVSIPETGPEF
jgi:hypothetical protein